MLALPVISASLLGGALPALAQQAAPSEAQVQTYEVAMGGNAYVTKQGADGKGGGGRNGQSVISNADGVVSVFFRVDRPAILDLALRAKVPQGESRIRVKVADKTFDKDLKNAEFTDIPLGKVSVTKAGYLKVDVQGVSKTGDVFAEIESVKATPTGKDAASVVFNYVKDNKDNRYYWGRRGPSVHLGYQLPKEEPTEWFYNEVTVPEGQDPIGSYYMSNGFGEGYFGMQVNSPTERRILFSVWSPFTTDNPKEIPEDHKIKLLKKGEGVHGGEFGGEGSGGQSYWLYPWKAGSTYRFLNRVHPDGKGQTNYTAWFYVPEKKAWQLIASFKRPKTDKYLTGAHSFLENFADRQGYIGRRAFYGNQWACDTKGVWHEVTEARFTCDDIGNRKYRLDFAGGAEGKRFFMRNGGFFAENVPAGSRFTRESTAAQKPVIDFTKLEGYNAE